MNVLNNSSDDVVECPLCMEPLEVDDLNFFPCTCGYQICRFCWHRIRTDENELCPACRKAYPENPADFTPLSQEQIAALKAEKRQRDQQRKQKITENRKHLANVRVVQKNLVFVVGLPPRLADADILKKYEYFGKYGKIHKVVINPSTTYAGVQGPSASAYVTYVNNNDALRAIQSVNNIMIDGRLIKTSLGTTKYCSHFMKNQQCPKGDCMYLHELGDSEASFTKEEMHQGKHQEYEKRLHDALIASSSVLGTSITPPVSVPIPNGIGINGVSSNNSITNSNINGSSSGSAQSKEAWPSLSVSPVNNEKEKEHQKLNSKNSKNNNGGNNKENTKKHDKTKGDKKSQKNQKSSNNNSNNNHNSNSSNNIHICNNKDIKELGGLRENNTTNIQIISEQQQSLMTNGKGHHKIDKTSNKESHKNRVNSLDDEINFIDQLEKADSVSSDDNNIKNINDNSSGGRSLSSSSSTSSASSSVSTTSVSSSSSNSDSVGSLSETASGKSSPGSFPDHISTTTIQQQQNQKQQMSVSDIRLENNSSSTQKLSENLINQTNGMITSEKCNKQQVQTNDISNLIDTSACLSKLSLFDDNNSFFSSSSFQPLLKGKLDNESRTLMNNQLNSVISSHLPDLLNGIDNYQNHSNHSLGSNATQVGGLGEDWEAAFKYVLMRNNKQMEEQQQHQHHHQQHQHQHSQEEFLRMQEIQKRNLLNSIGMNQVNGLHDFANTDFGGSDLSRLTQQALFHQQQQQQQQRQASNNLQHNDILSNSLFGSTNMSKFFDFHKSQQQQQQQHQQHQYMVNGINNGFMGDHRDHLSMNNILDNNRLGPQLLEHTNGLAGGQQLQKQRYNSNNNNNKYDQMSGHSNHSMLLSNSTSTQQQPPQNRIPNQFSQNSTVDDDLGFDPFIETQKALAELIENENQANLNANSSGHNKKQQNVIDNCQRTRMPPPPGFSHMNHMNAFGFGVPRAQGSKILPFMNMNGNGGNNSSSVGNGGNGVPPNIQQQQHQNSWTQNLGFSQNPIQLNEQQLQQHLQNGGNNLNKSGYGNVPDWTAIDPAILSFRQFPFSSHQQQPQHNTDMFMQHITQQNLQQSGQGFGHHGINNLLNQQQNSQNQMNFSSHSTNWLNNDQNLFMNSLGNGYNNTNNYDKFSIPMPPGLHSNNMNCMSGNKQQKTECIN